MSLTTVERVLVLRGADIFREIAGEDLVPVAALADEVRFEEGETIVREGDQRTVSTSSSTARSSPRSRAWASFRAGARAT